MSPNREETRGFVGIAEPNGRSIDCTLPRTRLARNQRNGREDDAQGLQESTLPWSASTNGRKFVGDEEDGTIYPKKRKRKPNKIIDIKIS